MNYFIYKIDWIKLQNYINITKLHYLKKFINYKVNISYSNYFKKQLNLQII